MLMLIFVELFGGAIETGANDYVTYVVPGVSCCAPASARRRRR